MTTRTRFCAVTVSMAVVLGPSPPAAQVQTEVPPAVPGAKPVTVEHIKLHGTSLEGNLEGNAVDRDVIVFVPPSYAKEAARRYPVVYAVENAKAPSDLAGLPFFSRAQLATAAAWSPNPKNPPLYLDLPTRDGQPQPEILAKWAANAPLALLDEYVGSLRRYRAIAIRVGDEDRLRADAGKLHDALEQHGIANTFEIYPGTHTSKVADRVQNHVMPFFSRSLCGRSGCQ